MLWKSTKRRKRRIQHVPEFHRGAAASAKPNPIKSRMILKVSIFRSTGAKVEENAPTWVVMKLSAFVKES